MWREVVSEVLYLVVARAPCRSYGSGYSGLPTFQVLKEVFDHVALAVPKTDTSKLTNFEQFMLVMLKLRLNARYQDLAYRFTVSVSTVS